MSGELLQIPTLYKAGLFWTTAAFFVVAAAVHRCHPGLAFGFFAPPSRPWLLAVFPFLCVTLLVLLPLYHLLLAVLQVFTRIIFFILPLAGACPVSTPFGVGGHLLHTCPCSVVTLTPGVDNNINCLQDLFMLQFV